MSCYFYLVLCFPWGVAALHTLLYTMVPCSSSSFYCLGSCIRVFWISPKLSHTCFAAHLRESKCEWHPCCGNLFRDYNDNSGDLCCPSVHLPIVFPAWRPCCALFPAERVELSYQLQYQVEITGTNYTPLLTHLTPDTGVYIWPRWLKAPTPHWRPTSNSPMHRLWEYRLLPGSDDCSRLHLLSSYEIKKDWVGVQDIILGHFQNCWLTHWLLQDWSRDFFVAGKVFVNTSLPATFFVSKVQFYN